MRPGGALRGYAVFHTSVSPLILLFDFVAGDSVTLRRTAAKHEKQNQDELENGADTGAAAAGKFCRAKRRSCNSPASACRKSLSLRAGARREASALGVPLGMTGVRSIDTPERPTDALFTLSFLCVWQPVPPPCPRPAAPPPPFRTAAAIPGAPGSPRCRRCRR